MMIESGYGYDQRDGSFNAGSVSDLGWAIAPAGAGTEFEFRVSLGALYPDGTKVFGTHAMRLLLQDDRGPESAVETGIAYSLAAQQPGPLSISRSGTQATITWTGPGAFASCKFTVGRLVDECAECDESLHDSSRRGPTVFSIGRVKLSWRKG